MPCGSARRAIRCARSPFHEPADFPHGRRPAHWTDLPLRSARRAPRGVPRETPQSGTQVFSDRRRIPEGSRLLLGKILRGCRGAGCGGRKIDELPRERPGCRSDPLASAAGEAALHPAKSDRARLIELSLVQKKRTRNFVIRGGGGAGTGARGPVSGRLSLLAPLFLRLARNVRRALTALSRSLSCGPNQSGAPRRSRSKAPGGNRRDLPIFGSGGAAIVGRSAS